jgi:hypothetical protein
MAERDGARGAGQGRVSLTPEWSLLVACARHATGSGRDGAGEGPAGATSEAGPLASAPVDGRATSAAPDAIDWEALLELADRHGLSAFLQRFLERVAPVEAPPPVLARLRERVRLRTRENLRHAAGLIALAPAMEAAGIDTMTYKGPVLSERLHGNPTLRDYDDLDLLVRERDVDEATRFLQVRGLRPWFELKPDQEGRLGDSQYARHFGNAETGVAVDLHWGFAQPYLSSGLDEATIWADPQEVALGPVRLRTLADPLLLLVLCVHGSKHEPHPWNRLKWIVDVAGLSRLIPGDRWGPLVTQARALHLERPLLFGLLVAHRLLATPLAPPVEERLRAVGDIEPLADAVLATLTSPSGDAAPTRIDYDLRLLDRRRDRVRYVLHRLFVPNPKDWAVVELPRWLAPAYYVLRPFRLLSASLSRSAEPR